jgi:hypothetical protein
MAAKYRTGTGAMNLDTKGRVNRFNKTSAKTSALAMYHAGLKVY